MDYKSHFRAVEFVATAFDTADICAVEVGAFGELFLGEVLRLPARADVVSKFSEGGVGWHPQTIAECGSAAAKAMADRRSGHGR